MERLLILRMLRQWKSHGDAGSKSPVFRHTHYELYDAKEDQQKKDPEEFNAVKISKGS